IDLFWITEPPPFSAIAGSLLPYGKGRSYGDVCLNDGGTLLLTEALDHFISFDPDSGALRCEAGVTLEDVLKFAVPQGWFLPVTPGTKFVTVAGAVANDVHGKNHHLMGTFGEHVQSFELLRSDQQRLVCSKSQNPEMFHATIGGMGLTGLILWVEFQLKRINNPFIAVEEIQYRNLDEFFTLAEESEGSFEYTVAWVDCLARGSGLGKGIFMRGNDATRQQGADAPPVKAKKQVGFPFDAPNFLLNRLTVSAFNSVYYHKQFRRRISKLTHYDPFFYPLDSIHEWNRLYGKRGFLQYQFVVPPAQSREVIVDVLGKIARSGTASFLSVMKTFGERPPAGLMSFPRKGLTLALDLPNLGEPVMRLLETLDEIVLQNGGVVYPAKDARMSARHFQLFYPQWKEFARFMDPRFSSSFWRRVTTG
ncbi:MAG: hypothetical protein QOJ40_2955, partial [Verrucomicrobiota bacterium]